MLKAIGGLTGHDNGAAVSDSGKSDSQVSAIDGQSCLGITFDIEYLAEIACGDNRIISQRLIDMETLVLSCTESVDTYQSKVLFRAKTENGFQACHCQSLRAEGDGDDTSGLIDRQSGRNCCLTLRYHISTLSCTFLAILHKAEGVATSWVSGHISLNQAVVEGDKLTDRGLTGGIAIERVVDDGIQSRNGLHHRTHNHTSAHLCGRLRIGNRFSQAADNLLFLTLAILAYAVHVRTHATADH